MQSVIEVFLVANVGCSDWEMKTDSKNYLNWYSIFARKRLNPHPYWNC